MKKAGIGLTSLLIALVLYFGGMVGIAYGSLYLAANLIGQTPPDFSNVAIGTVLVFIFVMTYNTMITQILKATGVKPE